MVVASTEPCTSVASAFEAFWKLRGQRHVAFLDSAATDPRWGRMSIVASDPVLVFTARGDAVEVRGRTVHFAAPGNPFTALRELAARFRADNGGVDAGTPSGALIGCFGYGLRRFVERVPSRMQDDTGAPDAWFGVYDRLLVFDHATGSATIVSTGVDEFGSPGADRARARAAEWQERLARPVVLPAAVEARDDGGPALRSNFRREDYESVVRRVQEYIAAGDVYQVNLSQRFLTETDADGPLLYHALRSANPAPFAAYLDCGAVQVLSSSPERFLRIEGRHVQTRPIKGTRPRVGNATLDQRAAQELLASAKDRAELLMITDLERNDLGRVCEYGSVRVAELARLESYATVFHLVATVEGRLAEGVAAVDAVRACFPGGSITGAPKIRAMEIIDELEPSARGVYTGAVGYLGFNDCADLNIAIRTLVYREGQVFFHAGGGIVADSVPAQEYEETLHKARGIVRALGGAEVLAHELDH
jgi:para-aminobenzoate synthetase component 1